MMPGQSQKPLAIGNQNNGYKFKTSVQLKLTDAIPQQIHQLVELREAEHRELETQLRSEKFWRQVLAKMPVGATLKLMLEHAQPIIINEEEVRVGFFSKKLIELANKDKQVLQAACEKVCGHQIRVNLILVR